MGKASGIRAGRAFVELGVDDKTSAGLKAVSAKMKRFADSVGAVGMSMLKMGAMMAAPLVAGAKVFSSMGDQIAKMARRTGMSTEALSELSYAASRSGTTVEALENSLRRMQRTIYDAGEGLSTAVDGLANLGLSLGELQGLKPEEQFKLMAQRLSEIEDPTTRAAMAMVLFGRSGTALLPMFEKGAAGIEELQAAARRLGLTISQEDAAAAEKFTDIIADLWKVIKQGLFTVGAALAEQLQTWAKDFTDTAASAKEFVDQHRQLVVVGAQVVKWTFVIGGSLVVLSKLFYAGAIAVKVFAASLTFLQAHPIVLGLTAIAAAALGVMYLMEKFQPHGEIGVGGGPDTEFDKELKHNIAMYEKHLAEREEERKKASSTATQAERAAAKARADVELDINKRLAILKLQSIEDEHQRNVALIRHRYELERKELFKLHASARAHDLLDQAERLALIPEYKRATEKAQQESQEGQAAIFSRQLDAWTKGLDQKDRIEVLRLRTQYEGVELQEKLLDLERERAIIAAVAAGENLDAVKEEFRLREKLLGVGKGITAGGAWRALGGRAFQTDPSIESLKQSGRETADNTRRIADGMETFMPRFT